MGLLFFKFTPVCCGSRRNCCNKITALLFIIIRMSLVLSLLYLLFYRLILIDYHTVAINFYNWWKSSKEPFLTNASYFNAFICWVLFLMAVPVLIMQIVYFLIFIIWLVDLQRGEFRIYFESYFIETMEYIFTRTLFL